MKQWMLGVLCAMMTLGGCTPKEEKPLVISVDTWIGAAPLYYAHAKGWLKEANIEMLQATSIEDNMNLYESHASDIVASTQHEYKRLLKTYPDLVPLIVYDRSYGGDMVMSNRTVQQLRESTQKIDIFVEFDTVGEDMLNYFLAEHNLSKDKFNVMSRTQEEIELTPNLPSGTGVIAVTYNPHDLPLKEHGFQEIANSRSDTYIVIDGVSGTRTVAKKHQEQIIALKVLLAKAVEAYHKKPKEFYATVKPYLGHPTYEEFEKMRGNVQWIKNEEIPATMKQKMVQMHYPVSELIK